MTHYDVFNGDADGICALQQLRLASPINSQLITGVKREISLLKQVPTTAGNSVTVLDVSLDKNRDALHNLLTHDINVHYFDHHFAGDIPQHHQLTVSIDTSPDTCTSLIVNQYLNAAQCAWAVVGAFGDNFDHRAEQAAATLSLTQTQLNQLRDLGIYINYNAYGATIDDLFIPPAKLYQHLHPYHNPLDFINDNDTFAQLQTGYHDDMAKAAALTPAIIDESIALYILPSQTWARRVSGVFANQLAQQHPDRAHALLTQLADDGNSGYLVSVRAPLSTKTGADTLCRQFPTGGGRQAAAGINQLPTADFDEFTSQFKKIFG